MLVANNAHGIVLLTTAPMTMPERSVSLTVEMTRRVVVVVVPVVVVAVVVVAVVVVVAAVAAAG